MLLWDNHQNLNFIIQLEKEFLFYKEIELLD